ncbi:hypothetical protein CJ178_30640 [Rhodococcus sp. ACPA4]|nr:hypothetical protein CJ178_30640 [Rhodococcus sp. ACPA4]
MSAVKIRRISHDRLEPPGAAHVTDVRINAARTKLIIDKKLKRTSKPQIERWAQLKTSGERRGASPPASNL